MFSIHISLYIPQSHPIPLPSFLFSGSLTDTHSSFLSFHAPVLSSFLPPCSAGPRGLSPPPFIRVATAPHSHLPPRWGCDFQFFSVTLAFPFPFFEVLSFFFFFFFFPFFFFFSFFFFFFFCFF